MKNTKLSILMHTALLNLVTPLTSIELGEKMSEMLNNERSAACLIGRLCKRGLCKPLSKKRGNKKYVALISEADILKIKVEKPSLGMLYVTGRTTENYIKKYVNSFKEKKPTPWDGLLRINL